MLPTLPDRSDDEAFVHAWHLPSRQALTCAAHATLFARWGSNYAYHIGDLSAVACPGHLSTAQSDKYRAWVARLFLDYPSAAPRLHRETFFWAKAWGNDEIGMWREYGPTLLTFLEYLLIGVASDLFPALLLNREGVNRR